MILEAGLTSLVPRPCAFVTCSMKFVQKTWSILSHDAFCSLRHNHPPEISDVIDELAACLALKEIPEMTVMVHVHEFRTASDKRTKPGNKAKYLPLQFTWHTTSSPTSSSNQLCNQQKQDY